MTKAGPIIIVDDDRDDWNLLAAVFQELPYKNELKFFLQGKDALEYLRTTTDHPFIIFSDVNMPLMDGLALRREIMADERLRSKSIPFVLLSTATRPDAVREAFELAVQGFFKKPARFDEFIRLMDYVMYYWTVCAHPNSTKMY